MSELLTEFLDQFKVILLDMNSTFMFGEDRFDDSEDFFATYQRLGGLRLGAATVNSAIQKCYRGMSEDYQNPSKIDDFPSLAEGFRQYAAIDERDLPLLEAVFAQHELGHIPGEYAACLRRLRASHKLGLVSNIWANKASWLAEFKRAGIDDLWHAMIFSSDAQSMKPSHRLIREAVGKFDVPLSEIVFVGDSLRADIVPAKSYGLATVWIDPVAKAHPLADRVVSSLLELAI